MANFLLEIGLEEVPAHLVTPAINQLVTRVADFFESERLPYGEIQHYSTPRRLAVIVTDVAKQAADIEEEMKGPIKKAALDANGEFTKAAEGFARGKGMRTDDIVFKTFNGQEFVTLTRHETGKSAEEVLVGMQQVVEAMTFSTTMKWGRHTFEYVRPIRWLVALLDDKIIPFQILDVATGRQTRGHRFLGKSVDIQNALDYVEDLKNVFVLADATERRAVIQQQVETIAKQHDWQVVIDDELLEEVNNIVEYPTAFSGSFDASYLEVPDEVLITSMKAHQRFFHVVDMNGELLPHFISVRNGNDQYLQNVIAGNEKVLVARLEDAKFFYHEDQKHDIAFYNQKLSVVSFHEKLGSVANHTHRAKAIALTLASQLNLDEAQQVQLARVADIYKFDLMTGMVGEFDELQGVMGEKYALIFGETPAVATAIREHYMPTTAEGELPTTILGKILALADKLDTLLAFFAGDMVPSGSNDPYALRRAATGVVNIISANQWELDLNQILTTFVDDVQQAPDHLGLPDNIATVLPDNIQTVINFLKDRIVKLLQNDIRRDIVEAVVQTQGANVSDMIMTARVLQAHSSDANFREGVEALTRVLRLTNKNTIQGEVEPEKFENDSERQLFSDVSQMTINSPEEWQNHLWALQPSINHYFDETMVMTDDVELQQNRLRTLNLIAQQAHRYANLMALQVK
ncbi:glycine--tRNA ligase subunit beta [Weissella diestrammenae]|uniref:Glycine--tRNA ligase beta subunit n=1 Tax=Weissella diestrammenae TaxID=1162633 RepID=A0A7G9T4T5_9LACO|nr:glycine--tRNA ligase subunit beta [Weissella diestrammenae]MCM0582822.1 glycine--tRNA ligase subunit beta [Weissella diestrammenae]QNN75110.1 glycine--tRNA ligase subunit beta [Weissella diestrammenae]